MITTRDQFDIRIGFSFIDYCLNKVDPINLAIYLVLRRFIWRRETGRLGGLYKEGLLCCSVSQSRIAEMVGLNRVSVCERIDKLRKMGWIETRKLAEGAELAYVIGERVRTSKGRTESYFADIWIENEVEKSAPPEENEGEEGEGGVAVADRDVAVADTPCVPSRQGVSSQPTPHIVEVDNRSTKQNSAPSPSAQSQREYAGGNTLTKAGGPAPACETPPGGPVGADLAPVVDESGEGATDCTLRSVRGGSGIDAPGSAAEMENPAKKTDKIRKRAMYDPAVPVARWRASDAVGYFRYQFHRAWPKEGAPDVSLKDMKMVGNRMAWLDAEKLGPEMMLKAIDYIFEKWSNGLPNRLKWRTARPSLALLETAYFFETIVKEIQHGPRRKSVDEYDHASNKGMPVVGWGDALDGIPIGRANP
jgi:hypothetical protein